MTRSEATKQKQQKANSSDKKIVTRWFHTGEQKAMEVRTRRTIGNINNMHGNTSQVISEVSNAIVECNITREVAVARER